MRQEDIPISDLLLDARNPRLGTVEDQASALERLVVIRPDHLRNLAKDIAERGLHPGIDFLVYPNGDGKFVVLDGNRRLAAIKLLTKPDTAPSAWTPIDTEAIVDAESLETLRCTIFESREEGRPWVERMHTGQMGGVGVVQWPPIAQHHFSPRNDQRGRGAAALAWLSTRTDTSAADTHAAIEKVENEEITTFGRFVQARPVRPILGYDFKGSELEPSDGISEDVLYGRLIAAVKDLAAGKGVNDLRDQEQRIEYAHLLAGSSPSEESEPDADEAEEPTTEESEEPTKEEPSTNTGTEGSGSEDKSDNSDKKEKTRRRNIPAQKFVLDSPLPDVYKPRIVRISEELCRLNVHETPNAVAVLLRLLLEMTTEQCRRGESLPKQGDLNDHIQNVINRVQTQQDQMDKVFHGLLVSLQDPNDRDHTKNFNQHVHNVEFLPVPTDLINTAHAYLPYFERIGERLASKTSN